MRSPDSLPLRLCVLLTAAAALPACLTDFGGGAGRDAAPPGDGGPGLDASGIPDGGPPDATLPDGALPDAGPNCGNGVTDPGEECDDGNATNSDDCTNQCRLARCGDAIFHEGAEQCDDGNASNTDACLTNCQTARCGDGYIWAGFETCDDGNAQGGDGCSTSCQVETGWTCAGQPSTCTPICGDGLQRGSEACDDGNLTAGDGCSPSCQVEALPVLRWIGGGTSWSSQILTWAGQPHAPSPAVYPIRAAVNAEYNDEALVLTATTYHVLRISSRTWIDSGAIGSLLPGLPPAGRTLNAAYGVSSAGSTSATLLYDDYAYVYTYDHGTGTASQDAGSPILINHWEACCGLAPPAPQDVRAVFLDLNNPFGWTSGSYSTICNPGCPCGGYCTSGGVGPYGALLTASGLMHLMDSGCCFWFYDQMPLASFPPFGQSGAPVASSIVAAFYDNTTSRLYTISQP